MKAAIAFCIAWSGALLAFNSVVVTVTPPQQTAIKHLDLHYVEMCDLTNPYSAPQISRPGIVTATSCVADTIFYGGFE